MVNLPSPVAVVLALAGVYLVTGLVNVWIRKDWPFKQNVGKTISEYADKAGFNKTNIVSLEPYIFRYRLEKSGVPLDVHQLRPQSNVVWIHARWNASF